MIKNLLMGKGALALGAALVGLFAVGHGHGSSSVATSRREVTGRSGTTWYTDAGGSDAISVVTQVWTEPKGGELVLSYRQFTIDGIDEHGVPRKQGDRIAFYRSPSYLEATAEGDFL
jgi:hypothetical protein